MPEPSSPHVDAAIAAAAAAAPVDRLRARWADDMRTRLGTIADPELRDGVAALVPQFGTDVVFAGAAEMLAFARIQYDARRTAGAPLEFTGTASSAIADPDQRTQVLFAEFERFWDDPPAPVRALSREDQDILERLHSDMILASGAQPSHKRFVGRDFSAGRSHRDLSGLKLHVSTEGVAETVELLARIVPLLPDVVDYKVATDRQFATGASGFDKTSGRATSKQQRKGITLYLPPDGEAITAKIVAALAGPRASAVIEGDHELAPGVFLRSEIHVRLPGVGFEDGYHPLYRDAHGDVAAADREAQGALLEHPELVSRFEEAVWMYGDIDTWFDPRAAVALSALGLMGPELDYPGANDAIQRRSTTFGVRIDSDAPANRPAPDIEGAFLRYAAIRAVIDAGLEINTDTLDAALRDGRAATVLRSALDRHPGLSNLDGFVAAGIERAPGPVTTVQPVVDAAAQSPFVTGDGSTWIYFQTRSGNIYQAAPTSEPGAWTLTDMRTGKVAENVALLGVEPGKRARFVSGEHVYGTGEVTAVERSSRESTTGVGPIEAAFLRNADRSADLAEIHASGSRIYFQTGSGNIYEVLPTSHPEYWMVSDMRSGRPAELAVIVDLQPGNAARFVTEQHVIDTSPITELEVSVMGPGRTPSGLEREFLTGIGNARISRDAARHQSPESQAFTRGN